MSYPEIKDNSVAGRMQALFIKIISGKKDCKLRFADVDWGTIPEELAKRMIIKNSVPGFTTEFFEEEESFVIKEADIKGLGKVPVFR